VDIMAPSLAGGGAIWSRTNEHDDLEAGASAWLAWLGQSARPERQHIIIYAETDQDRQLGELLCPVPWPESFQDALERMEPALHALHRFALWKDGRWMGVAERIPRIVAPQQPPPGWKLLEPPGPAWMSLTVPNHQSQLRVAHLMLDLGYVTPVIREGRVDLLVDPLAEEQVRPALLRGLADRFAFHIAHGDWRTAPMGGAL
jgi:hypothetical protein